MHVVWEMFMECGFAAYLVLLLSVLAGVAVTVALVMGVSRSRGAIGMAAVALVVATLAVGAGLGGTFWGRTVVDGILPAVDPDQRAQIRTIGYAEAQQCTNVGLGLGGLPLAGAVLALVLAVTRKPKEAHRNG